MNRRVNTDRWPLRGLLPSGHDLSTMNTLRASDQDREQTATRLRHAAAEGRLPAEELEDRLAGAFSAKTYGELAALVSDLPRGLAPDRRRPIELIRLRPALAAALLIALVLLAGALGLGIRRSSAAAPDQPRPPITSHAGAK